MTIVLWQSEASLEQIAQHLVCMWFLSPWGWLGVKGVLDAVKTGRGEFANSLIVQGVLLCRFFKIFVGHWVFFLLMIGVFASKHKEGNLLPPIFRFIALQIHF